MNVKPAIGFLRTDSDAALLAKAQTIVASMTSNPAYPTPSPALAPVTTAIDDFSTAMTDSADGGKELTAIKNARRAALATLLRNLAGYVAAACHGDMATLLSSGFPTQKPMPSPVSVLPAPETPVLTFGARTGELSARTAPLQNAHSYNWQVALASAPANVVRYAQTTAASTVLQGFTPGQVYLVKVSAFGAAGGSNWSDAAQLMVV